MDVARWERIQPMFEAAIGMEPDERDAFLLASCEDEDLRREVQALLEADDRAGGFLEEPAARVPDLDELTGPTLAPGMVLSQRFRLVRFLASGGMGEVYEAEDLELGEHVALKIVRPEMARDTAMMQRFRREVHLARQVTHPSVCRCFDIFHHHGALADQPAGDRARAGSLTFLTMELIRGETLSRYLEREGPLTTAQALPILQQIVAALTAAHERGIVHRDLKASNVMLDRSGLALRVVVMDFGLALSPACEDAWITGRGQVLGTPACMAPEQLMGGEISPATDVYALGVLMYRMLTGRAPFEAEETRVLAFEALGELPAPPRRHVPDLDPRWERVILRCLEYLPGARFASAHEVLARLPGPGPRPRAQRWRKAAAMVGGLAVAIAMAGTLVLAPPLRLAVLARASQTPTERALDFVQRSLEEIQLVAEARAHEAAHAWEEAADSYSRITALCPDDAGPFVRLATVRMRAGQPDQALAVLDELRAQPTSAGRERRVVLGIDLLEAEAAEAAADYGRALRAAMRAVQVGQEIGDDRLRGHAHYREARARWRLGDLDRALADARIADALHQATGDQLGRAATLVLQANVLEEQARPDWARMLYEQAQSLYVQLGHQPGILEVLINLAIVVEGKGHRDEALDMFEQAARLADAIGDRDGEARALHNQARIYKNQGTYDVALMLYEQTLVLAREIGNEAIQSAALSSQASVLRMQGKLEEAAASYTEALRLAEQIGDRQGMSSRRNNLGVTLRLQGNLPGALEHFEKALNLARELDDSRGEAQRLTNMGMILRMQGKLDEAQGKLDEALTAHARIDDPDGRAFTWRSLGLLRLARGDLRQARSALEGALSVGSLAEKAEGLLARRALAALAFEEGDLRGAEVLVQQVIDELTALEHKDEALDGWLLLARIQLARGRVARAQAVMQEAEAAMRKAGPQVSQDLERRLRTRLVTAEIDAAAGKRSRAAASLEALERNADGAGMIEIGLEIRLARAALALAEDPARGRDALRALADQAGKLGFYTIAKKARSLTESRANSRLP